MGSSRKSKIVGRILMCMGGMLVVCAISIFGYNYWSDYRAGEESEKTAKVIIEHISEQKEEDPPEEKIVEDKKDEGEEKEKRLTIDGVDYIGILSIPYLKLTLPVQDSWSLKKLKISPCLYYSDETEGKNMVIAAHNYVRHFGKLHRLKTGSELIFTDASGKKSYYTLKEKFTVNKEDIDSMINSKYDLTLFTCTYSGDARVTLRYSLRE